MLFIFFIYHEFKAIHKTRWIPTILAITTYQSGRQVDYHVMKLEKKK